MKKILLLVIAIMTFAPMTNAQIKKTGESNTKTIASVRMGIVVLRQSDKDFYLSMTTTNQFDNAMLLKLGDTKESAKQSLNDLLDILESLDGDASQYIDNGFGRELRLWKLMGALYISADGYAGNGNIAKSELKKFIKALQE